MTKLPDYCQQEEFQNRSRKLADIRQACVEPYPHTYTPTQTALQLHQQFEHVEIGHSDDAAAGTTPIVRIAGRIVLFRQMGKNTFAHLQDETDAFKSCLTATVRN